MITKMRVKHFRSIEDAEFTLAPLTVLVGPNASGKSNLLDVFGFLGDVARDGLESAVTRRGGIDSIGWRSPSGKVLGPELYFEFDLPSTKVNYGFALTRRAMGNYAVKRETARVETPYIESLQKSVKADVAFQGDKLAKPSHQSLLKRAEQAGLKDSQYGDYLKGTLVGIAQVFAEQGDKVLRLLPADSLQTIWNVVRILDQRDRDNRELPTPGDVLRQGLLQTHDRARTIGLYHIFPNTLRSPQRMADSHPLGVDGGNLASTLRDMLNREDSFAGELKLCLAAAVPGIKDIRVSSAGSHHVVELNHARPGGPHKNTWFDLVHEADGTIRLLAMFTALYQDPSPSLVCLEEPEVGIHPGALSVISDVLQEAPLRGQVLVTTHSPELIDMLPVESLRAVSAESGSTKVGPVTEHQLRSVRRNLMSLGELHSMEGLEPATAREQAD